jgi:2-polyprenyl-3-methyl-5-hydroxy-6-metoxy-1,4-benzoquinol methylase
VINERFKFSDKHSVYLNKNRIRIRNKIQQFINDGNYKNEQVECYVCNSKYEEHQLISEVERHGLGLSSVVCKNCGLIFTNPRMDKKSYNDFYTQYYRDLYNYDIGENDLDSLFQSNYTNGIKVYEFVKPFIKKKSNVLEIGCANGGLLKYFSEQGHNVTGLDLGEAEVIYGQERFGLNLIHKSVDDYIGEEKQDVIIMIHVIEHLIDPEITMRKIHENLSDSGLVYISCPDVDTLSSGLIYKSDWLTLMQNAHTINFDKVSIENLLGKYGFKIVYFEPGMNLVAQKNNKLDYNIKNNFANSLKNITDSEKVFQSRLIQNKIRRFFEINGIFAFLIYTSKPLNSILVKIGIQKYIKSFLKLIYKYI